ncbi:MAG TPA: hypothetical protein VHW60_07650, partial [Caulobacteraceae bacterium]|nr:hypothetical protein [Caulobacteraceae bacterium]
MAVDFVARPRLFPCSPCFPWQFFLSRAAACPDRIRATTPEPAGAVEVVERVRLWAKRRMMARALRRQFPR